MQVYRQGDVILKRLEAAPDLAQAGEKPDLTLAYGEATGHAHRITEGRAKLYTLATGVIVLRVLSEYARLFHEEHHDILLPKGDYDVGQQREWDWQAEMTRNVAD